MRSATGTGRGPARSSCLQGRAGRCTAARGNSWSSTSPASWSPVSPVPVSSRRTRVSCSNRSRAAPCTTWGSMDFTTTWVPVLTSSRQVGDDAVAALELGVQGIATSEPSVRVNSPGQPIRTVPALPWHSVESTPLGPGLEAGSDHRAQPVETGSAAAPARASSGRGLPADASATAGALACGHDDAVLRAGSRQPRAPRLGAHVRRRRGPARRRRVGRAGGVPLARARGGRQGRALLPGLLRDPGLRGDRARHPGRDGGALLGRRRHRPLDRRAPPWPRPASSANGTPEQLSEWAPQMFGEPGDLKVAAFCSSEPDAGSDVGAMRTRATYDEATDEWVLNGTKTWATNGGLADIHVVTAVVDPELRRPRPGELRGPARHQGPEPGPEVRTSTASGPRTPRRWCSTRCGSPAAACSAARTSSTRGWPGPARAAAGAANASMATFERTRPAVGAQAVGIARAAYEVALDYAKTREQFGKPIIENQAIAFTLADMATSIEAAGCWSGGRRGWPARARPSTRPRARCRSCSPARPRCG